VRSKKDETIRVLSQENKILREALEDIMVRIPIMDKIMTPYYMRKTARIAMEKITKKEKSFCL